MFERPERGIARLRDVRKDITLDAVAHGFIGWVFAATAPVAVILSVGTRGGLSEAQLASWIFGAFFVNGLITLSFSWIYRTPLAFFWTIPGAVLVGPALSHLSFPEVIGAYYATGALMLALGVTGWVKRAMRLVPMPIVMGMVSGVFLRFGLDLVRALHEDVLIAAPMVLAWLLLNAKPRIGRVIPPIIGAMVLGGVAAIALGRFDVGAIGQLQLAHPIVPMPAWSLPAMVELVVPLMITVLVVQNGQGIAVLSAAGHTTPINAATIACGIGSIASAAVGAVSTCLAGPTNAILTSSGAREKQYVAGLTTGLLSVMFGLLAPAFTRMLLSAPKAFIMTLAGLAMLRVLQAAFIGTFRDRFTLGGLVAFLVTVADIGMFNIGAAFWGLIAGMIVSWLIERNDFAQPA